MVHIIEDPNVQKLVGTIIGLIVVIFGGKGAAIAMIGSRAKTLITTAEKMGSMSGQEKMDFVVNEIMQDIPALVRVFKGKTKQIQDIVQKQVDKSTVKSNVVAKHVNVKTVQPEVTQG